VALAEPLVEPLSGVVGRAARPVAIVGATLVLTFVTLVFTELAPKRIAMQRAAGWGMVAAGPLSWIAVIAGPVIWLLGKSSDLVVRASGVDPSKQRDEVTEEERGIIRGAFDFADRSLRQTLTPRPAVVALPADLPVGDAARRLADTGHKATSETDH
jgi:putative hemolysin